MGTNKTKALGRIALFSALLSICAWIAVPSVVPYTLQTFAVLLSAAVLGGRDAAISVLVYIALGVLGLPVFSGGRAGFGVLFGATGGYILGFLPCSYVAGSLCEKTKKRPILMSLSMLAGLLCDYIFGAVWFWALYLDFSGFASALAVGVAPFVAADILKIALASFVAVKLQKIG